MFSADIGFIFALRQEAVGILDRLKHARTTHGDGQTFYTGKIGNLAIAVVLSGIGQKNAEEAAQKLIGVFRPKSVCSAGYAGGLSARLKRFHICVPEQVVRESDGRTLDLSEPIPRQMPLMSNKLTLITVNDVVETPKQKRTLNERSGAEFVDMETYAIADVCRSLDIPLFAYRVIFDTVGDQIPPDIAKILGSLDKGMSRMTGTILNNIWSRPSVVLDFVSLKKRAFTATERLARFVLTELVRKTKTKQLSVEAEA